MKVKLLKKSRSYIRMYCDKSKEKPFVLEVDESPHYYGFEQTFSTKEELFIEYRKELLKIANSLIPQSKRRDRTKYIKHAQK
jgi:hypothetical protein